jgi:hypothetical protein
MFTEPTLGLVVREALVDVDRETAAQLMDSECVPFEVCQVCRDSISACSDVVFVQHTNSRLLLSLLRLVLPLMLILIKFDRKGTV